MGCHDIYCVICGITASGLDSYNNDIKYLTKIIKTGKFDLPSKSKKYIYRLSNKSQKITPELLLNYKKYINDVLKLRATFKWCSQLYLITHDKVIKDINTFDRDDWGGFTNMKAKKGYQTQLGSWIDVDDITSALICHKSCYNLLCKKLNYKLKINDIYNKLNEISLLSNYKENLNKYIGLQDFPWTKIIIDDKNFINFENIMALNKELKINYNNINFLTDPLKNSINAKRIIGIWKPIIRKNKKKIRPSPSESATLYKIGTIKKGNDGNLYIIYITKNKIKKWKRNI